MCPSRLIIYLPPTKAWSVAEYTSWSIAEYPSYRKDKPSCARACPHKCLPCLPSIFPVGEITARQHRQQHLEQHQQQREQEGRASPVPGRHRIKNPQSASPYLSFGTTSTTSPASPGDRPSFRFLYTDVVSVLFRSVSLAGAEEPGQWQATVGYEEFVGDIMVAKSIRRHFRLNLEQLELLKVLKTQVREEGSDDLSFHKGDRQVYLLFIFHFPPSHSFPGHFQHAGDLAVVGSQTRFSSPTTRPVRAFRFYRALGSAFPALVDFHRSLGTHSRSALSTRKV